MSYLQNGHLPPIPRRTGPQQNAWPSLSQGHDGAEQETQDGPRGFKPGERAASRNELETLSGSACHAGELAGWHLRETDV